MLSAGSVAFMDGVGQLGVTGAALAAAFCTILLTLLCAMPLAWVDQRWTRLLARLTRPLAGTLPVAEVTAMKNAQAGAGAFFGQKDV